MDISGEGFRHPYVKKIGSSNLDRKEKSLLGKEIIRPTLPTPWKVRLESRCRLPMWKHLQGQKS